MCGLSTYTATVSGPSSVYPVEGRSGRSDIRVDEIASYTILFQIVYSIVIYTKAEQVSIFCSHDRSVSVLCM